MIQGLVGKNARIYHNVCLNRRRSGKHTRRADPSELLRYSVSPAHFLRAGRSNPLTPPIRQIGTFALVSLLLLRLGIGWHFFKEGAKKFQGESFTSVYFLQTAKGPLADF